jgi:hypothetical protein
VRFSLRRFICASVSFLYNNSNSDFFKLLLTDYLFDYGYYGDLKVVFSQQLILAEGGFKIKLDTPYAING